MLAPLATIAFLSLLWLAIVAVARTLEGSGSAILSAIAGRSPLAAPRPALAPSRLNPRATARIQRPVRVTPTLRAAA
jgi:hypothetical protein